jgi:glutamate N-acetyltransferase/amino-acid N-acetyltransferase
MTWKNIEGGVSQAKGFLANGLSCGIKRSGKPDLALIFSTQPAKAAGVLTQNSVKAAPILVTQQNLKRSKARAVICNSGNANCFTGDFGLIYARQTTELFAKLLQLDPSEVLVASTGIIGQPLPFEKIAKSAQQLVDGLAPDKGSLAAQGILTTDTFTKERAVTFKIDGVTVTIGGCAKGSGMIAPNMATMLGFITTDAVIDARLLKSALKQVVDDTFNCITVDGCMSTNDMVSIMANGAAQNKPITQKDGSYQTFVEALHAVCDGLAKMIVLDGEGATKFIEIRVQGAATKKQAKSAAQAVANSNLVKTAAHGCNPNWGRVAAAIGSLGYSVTEENMKIHFSSFKKKNICITVDLQQGECQAVVYTCDLSEAYVRINAEYN